jgi:hypothetical protein
MSAPDVRRLLLAERDGVPRRTTLASMVYEGVLKIAAATALQKSESKPAHSPSSPGAAKPVRPVWTPHLTAPLARTSSSVLADATEAVSARAAVPTIPLMIVFIPSYPSPEIPN